MCERRSRVRNVRKGSKTEEDGMFIAGLSGETQALAFMEPGRLRMCSHLV